MELIQLVVILIVVGVLLWLVNTYGAPYIDAKILTIIKRGGGDRRGALAADHLRALAARAEHSRRTRLTRAPS